MRLTSFFKLYNICILLHSYNLFFKAKNWFEKSAIGQLCPARAANPPVQRGFGEVFFHDGHFKASLALAAEEVAASSPASSAVGQ